jgi:uracil phosphoribosyltransferase
LIATLEVISEYINPKKCIICCLHGAQQGIDALEEKYPDIKIYSVFGPSDVNEHYYIVNGPGDCGDRCFNTN